MSSDGGNGDTNDQLSTDCLILKDGPLAHVWQIALSVKDASSDPTKKTGMSKEEIQSVSVPKAVKEVEMVSSVQNKTLYLNLRYTSHLLLGIAKLYQLNAQYLLEDCSQTLNRVRLFNETAIKILEKGKNDHSRTEAMNLLEAGLAPLILKEADPFKTPKKHTGATLLRDADFYQHLDMSSKFKAGLDFISELQQRFVAEGDFDDFGFDLVPGDYSRDTPRTPVKKNRAEPMDLDMHVEMDLMEVDHVPQTPVAVAYGLPTPITNQEVKAVHFSQPFVPLSPTSPSRRHVDHVDQEDLIRAQEAERAKREREHEKRIKREILEKNSRLTGQADAFGDHHGQQINELYDDHVDALMKIRVRAKAPAKRYIHTIGFDEEIALSIGTIKGWQGDTSNITLEPHLGMHLSNISSGKAAFALEHLSKILNREWVYPSRLVAEQRAWEAGSKTDSAPMAEPQDYTWIRNKNHLSIFSAVDEPLPTEFKRLVQIDRVPRAERQEIKKRAFREAMFEDFMDEPVRPPKEFEDQGFDEHEQRVDERLEVRLEEKLEERHEEMDPKRPRSPSPVWAIKAVDGQVYNWNNFLPRRTEHQITFFNALPVHETPREAAAKMFHDLLVFATGKKLIVSQQIAYGDIIIGRAFQRQEELVVPPEEMEANDASDVNAMETEQIPAQSQKAAKARKATKPHKSPPKSRRRKAKKSESSDELVQRVGGGTGCQKDAGWKVNLFLN